MSNKALSLFIFEGSKTEGKLIQKLESQFLGNGSHDTIKCVFDAEIYQLYQQINSDFTLDIVNLLKERNPTNAKILEGYTRDSFAYTYLFFDYDAHSTLANDAVIQDMLSIFNNDTELGMLYISYPMAEAIRHYKDYDSFKHLTVKCKYSNCSHALQCPNKTVCKDEPSYKAFVQADSDPQLSNMNKYDFHLWKTLITAHLCKTNYLVNDNYSFPKEVISQTTIFQKQLEKHIQQKCPQVAVLSAFPLYVLDFYGCENLKIKLSNSF